MREGNGPEIDNQETNSDETDTVTVEDHSITGSNEFESVVDVSGKNLELSLFEGGTSTSEPVDGLYVYRNVFNLFPKSLGSLGGRLKTLKFFGNEINLFSAEFGDLVGLECLQLKLSSLGLTGLPLHKLKALKELELSKTPARPSTFPILSEIVALKRLTKLSVCHFSVRYLPPEIACLSNLEYLDLSFNKMKSLPKEIGSLNALISLRVANNKLVELPTELSSLRRLENLDLSRNRLTSLGDLELNMMQSLQNLNLQHNKLHNCEIPSWICCNLEGNKKNASSDDLSSCTVEMDVLEAADDGSSAYNASSNKCVSLLVGSSSSNRCFLARRMGKRWRRRKYLQHRARRELLNSSRKWKLEDHASALTIKVAKKCSTCRAADSASESLSECASVMTSANYELEQPLYRESKSDNLLNSTSKKGLEESCSCIASAAKCEINVDCDKDSVHSPHSSCIAVDREEGSSSELSKTIPKSKRLSERVLRNPKPRKSRRSIDSQLDVSHKYSVISFCSIEDRLPDGFYDAGRDRPFLSLNSYDQNLNLNSREVILLDREGDENLDAITLSAQALMRCWKELSSSMQRRDHQADDILLLASWLALFVSDHFGGSDTSSLIQRVRKDVSGSNYCKPFVCTCSTGNSENLIGSAKTNIDSIERTDFCGVFEKSVLDIRTRLNSTVVPIGSLRFGVCRHRAVLMKYLCDRMDPPVPCELIRGFLDFSPHAWNAVLVKKGDSWVRMVVDACHPHDIREETDQEYFCRYMPLNRINGPLIADTIPASASSFPSLSSSEELKRSVSSSVVLCKLGSIEAAAKVRKLEISGTSPDEIAQFEFKCLAEVRILGVVRGHSCIVELYGHRICSEWLPASDGRPRSRILQCTILMEYVKGGSLKKYIDKLSKSGEKRLPVALALSTARDVAGALKELHSKHIIHRDVKSENVLIDLDEKRMDGSPVVKLCDFDIAVPLRSSIHSCCIAHRGTNPPNTCVGTPPWMAPEVIHAMHEHKNYGLEVDIWSFGCMILELLTLQIPYSGLGDSVVLDMLQSGKRPPLPDDLEVSLKDPAESKTSPEAEGSDSEFEALRFLVDLFRSCTEASPADRPTAEKLNEMLSERASSFYSKT